MFVGKVHYETELDPLCNSRLLGKYIFVNGNYKRKNVSLQKNGFAHSLT